MQSIYQAVRRREYVKTCSLNVAEVMEKLLLNSQNLSERSIFSGQCRIHTLIHIQDLSLCFTCRAKVTFQRSMPKGSKCKIDYGNDSYGDWTLEKSQCSKSINLDDLGVQKTISYLMNNFALEYTIEQEDSVVLQFEQYLENNKPTSSKGPNTLNINNSIFANILNTPILRDMDRFFSKEAR